MTANIPQAVRHLIAEYRRFLRTSYRFLDEHLRRQFEEHLAKADVVVKGPYVTLAREFERGPTLEALATEGLIERELLEARWPFGKERLYSHQVRGLAAGRAGRCFVVTTGTGSGKTEAFLLPVLDGILRRKREGKSGVQAVLLYPMNALANDQLERLRRLLRGSGLDLSFGLYTGDSDVSSQNLREDLAETERLTRDDIRKRPPDILLTNYKQLEFLLVRREDRRLFGPALRYLVLDEVHSYRGALASEIACLIRRLKSHAGIPAGGLVGIGTSATVAGGKGGTAALARFATTLFGEAFSEEDVLGDVVIPPPRTGKPWRPPPPALSEEDLLGLDPSDDGAVLTLARRLTGKAPKVSGAIAERVASLLDGNAVVECLEDVFATPRTVAQAAAVLRESFPDRAELPEEHLLHEIEACLLVGSIGDEGSPPRLRPKLHTFFHGVYDAALCLKPDCRALVPQGGAQCVRCGSAARPAALCRTCGQDFVKVRFEKDGDDRPVGTGDFYSDSRTGFLTHRIHELSENLAGDDEEEGEANGPPPASGNRRRAARAVSRLEEKGICSGCGRVLEAGATCYDCGRPALKMLLWRGKMSTCPACGDIYTRGDIVTPLRTGGASTVSVLTTHHLDRLAGEDRKLLLFADNRQDVAHQAGYTADKHRSFILRHVIAHAVRKSGAEGLALEEVPQVLLDEYLRLRIIRRQPTQFERRKWLDALRYEVASEVTRYSRQRASLENLGLVAVEYEFLEELAKDE